MPTFSFEFNVYDPNNEEKEGFNIIAEVEFVPGYTPITTNKYVATCPEDLYGEDAYIDGEPGNFRFVDYVRVEFNGCIDWVREVRDLTSKEEAELQEFLLTEEGQKELDQAMKDAFTSVDINDYLDCDPDDHDDEWMDYVHPGYQDSRY